MRPRWKAATCTSTSRVTENGGGMSGELENQVAVVTGSGQGFGRAIVRAMAEAGASVVVSARSTDQIDEVAAEINTAGGRAIAVRCDVTERSDVENLRAAAENEFGTV